MGYKGTGGNFREIVIMVNLIIAMISWVYTFVKLYKIVHSKYVILTVLQFYLMKL